MQAILQGLDVLLPVAYAALVGLYAFAFAKGEDTYAKARKILLFATLGVHAVYFLLRGVKFGYFPLGSQAEFLSWVALSIGGVYALIENRTKSSKTGVFFLTLSFGMQTFATVLMEYSTKHPVLLENPVYALHAFFMVFGITALATGTIYALMYAVLSRQIKQRELGMFFKRLPPLTSLEKMTKTGTFAGFVLLGLGLVIGHLVAFTLPETVNHLDPKFIISDAIWIGYGIGIAFVKLRGLPGLKIAYLSIVWFTVLLVSVGLASHSFLQ